MDELHKKCNHENAFFWLPRKIENTELTAINLQSLRISRGDGLEIPSLGSTT